MRLAAILLTTVVLACGSTPGAEDGQGGEPGDSSSSGGSSTGAASGDGDSGGSPGTGGESTGGTDTGGTNTGGNSTGGAEATGGSATGGSGTGGAPSACSPPVLVQGVGSGDDLNNVCGWTTETVPTGYAKSRTVALDCAAPPTGMVRHLASDDPDDIATWGGTIWRSTYVSVIDAADTCETGTMDGVDRKYSFSGDHCMKISSPFAGLTWDGFAVSGGCGVSDTPGEAEINLGEPGWVHVDVAALEGVNCPLSCD